jgi:tRNA A37 threonylcarbamoyladenosine synthetase subunit TsaC/SUA5/YrdC
VLDAGSCGVQATTIVDLPGAEAVLVRQGRGDIAALGV